MASALTQGSPQPAIATDRQLRILEMNQPAGRFFGLSPQAPTGRPLLGELLEPVDGQPPPSPEAWSDSRVFRAKVASGRPAFVVLSVIPLDREEGWLFLACDVTNLYLDHREVANTRAIYLMLSAITGRLLETDLASLGQDVSDALRTAGLFLGMSCAYLCRLPPGDGQVELVGGWWRDAAVEMDQDRLRSLLAKLPDFLAQLRGMRAIHQTSSQDDASPDDRPGMDYLRSRGAGAVIALPLISEENLLGHLICERQGRETGWPPDEVMMLRTIAEALSLSLARLDVEERRFEQTQYLTLLLETLQTGVMVSDGEDGLILGINKHARELIGADGDLIVGRGRSLFLERVRTDEDATGEAEAGLERSEWLLNTASGERLNVLRTAARAGAPQAGYLVECFSDISALKRLMENQRLDVGLAKRLLGLVEGPRPRHLDLGGGMGLFFSAIALSCMDEGGDHYLVRELAPSMSHDKGQVLVSLKDQSGHQVGCVLRSITTDLLHQHLVSQDPDDPPEAVLGRLNDLLCRHRLLAEDDFLTAVVCQIDKAVLELRFVSCGHPPFLLARRGRVGLCPSGPGRPGANLFLGALAGREFGAGQLGLEAGDRLILYTDGLLEAAGDSGAGGRAFRAQDLADLAEELLRPDPDLGVEELMRRLLDEVSRRGGRRLDPLGVNQSRDDVTLVGLQVEDLAWAGEEVWRPAGLERLQESMDRYFQERAAEWERLGFAEPLRLKICLEEMVANAYHHGNRGEPGSPITLRHRYGNDFHLQVADGGPGFAWAAHADRAGVDDPKGVSGRGIFLLKLHAGHLAWNQAGNQVSVALPRRRASARPGAAAPPPGLWR